MLLEDVFRENCYLLQAIRYIVKSGYLEEEEEREKEVEVLEEEEEGS